MPMERVNGADIAYDVSGDGPPLVFIHGITLTKELWEPQVDALASSHTVLRYDLRGHGGSDGTATAAYSYDRLADDLDALLGSLGIEDPVVCGHSLGAGVAAEYAAKYPDELSRLVLVGMGEASGYRVAAKRKVRSVATSLPARLLSDERADAVVGFLINLLTGGPDFDPEEMPGGRIPEAEMEKYAPLLERGTDDFPLAEISVPTLILTGEHEPADGSTVATQIPTATCETVPAAGHVSNWDNPQAFTSALESFLSRAETPRVS
ncbi:alpha/beta fold hydrolase [Halobacterium rubrum]|uniref:alpha/beta fold hydrolase n=1 Tax=Halobacterium TaxID=2239 RepID=UPI001F2E3958|nr:MULTISPECIES: alpha/beta fold hydrolase [Halobacterium]MDH5018905.1 alpha/beta fold hydrolase [Halobacterium rubrum]